MSNNAVARVTQSESLGDWAGSFVSVEWLNQRAVKGGDLLFTSPQLSVQHYATALALLKSFRDWAPGIRLDGVVLAEDAVTLLEAVLMGTNEKTLNRLHKDQACAADYWIVESQGNTGVPTLYTSKAAAKLFANSLTENGWLDVELVPLHKPSTMPVPEGYALVEVGITPVEVVRVGVGALTTLKQAGVTDPQTLATAVFQDMLTAVSRQGALNRVSQVPVPDESYLLSGHYDRDIKSLIRTVEMLKAELSSALKDQGQDNDWEADLFRTALGEITHCTWGRDEAFTAREAAEWMNTRANQALHDAWERFNQEHGPTAMGEPVLPSTGQKPKAYACPAGCGCLWRDNGNGTMSLYGVNSQSCDTCEVMPLDQLQPLYDNGCSDPKAPSVLSEIRAERERQDAKWGGPEHDDQYAPALWTWLIQDYAGWARVMAGMDNTQKYRKRVIQIAALAVAAVEAFDRNQTSRE